jgi:ATP-dependent DNA ligase
METVMIARWQMPFFPMRPRSGPRLTRRHIERILQEQHDHVYVFQPKLNGHRVMLGIGHKGEMILANRHGGLYTKPVINTMDFRKFNDGTLFDGEVYAGVFYPFECLALEGRSFRPNTTEERIILAMQMCRLAGVQWVYPTPTRDWLWKLDGHMPRYEGLVRKVPNAPYSVLHSASATSQEWLKLKW